MKPFGRIGNDLSLGVGGPRLFKETNTRFQNDQGIFSILGPSVGFMLGTLPPMLQKGARGDFEDLKNQVARKMPIMNVVYLQMIARYMDLIPTNK